MMKIDDIKRIEKELKKSHLIDPSRKILPDVSHYCNFGFKDSANEKVIIFDPTSLDFLDEDGVIFSLLHEEGHLVIPQKQKWRKTIIIAIWCILMFISILLSVNLFVNSHYLFCLTIIVTFVAPPIILHYINLRYFYQAYWDDEFSADEYAIRGLMQIRPNVIPWMAFRSSFNSLDRCEKHRKRPLPSQIWYSFNQMLKLTKHPYDEIRFKKAEELFTILNKSS